MGNRIGCPGHFAADESKAGIAPKDIAELKEMITKHLKYTGSRKAKQILDNWEDCLTMFVKVFPMEYRHILGQMIKEDAATEREEVVSR